MQFLPVALPIVFLVASSVCGFMATGWGQPPLAKDGAGKRVPEPQRRYYSATECSSCHTLGNPTELPLQELVPNFLKRVLVRRDEFKTWNNEDKHRRAYEALIGPRGNDIGQRLGYDVARSASCLSCHGPGFTPNQKTDNNVEVSPLAGEGVSCASCHGADERWVKNHNRGDYANPDWRAKDASQKSAEGLTDLRDPAVRAKVCTSCHIGDARQDKVVTHTMYAAGHPPLPGIELSTFSAAMPPHWWSPGEVPLFQEEEPESLRSKYHVKLDEPLQTRTVVIGALAALSRSMTLLADQTRREAPEKAPVWPEYAAFDCYACHHELEAPGHERRRQIRGLGLTLSGEAPKGKPGRPRVRNWPLALARLARAQLENQPNPNLRGYDELATRVKALEEACDATPFGHPEQLASAAESVASASDRLLEEVKGSTVDTSSPRKMLETLCKIPAAEYPDFDSARQMAWAFKAIYRDREPKPEIDAILGKLDKLLKLNPYESRQARSQVILAKKNADDLPAPDLLKLSEAEFAASLNKAADYDPREFKKILAELGKLL